MNAVHSARVNVRIGLVEPSFESRTPTTPGAEPTSTQPFAWLREDLRQFIDRSVSDPAGSVVMRSRFLQQFAEQRFGLLRFARLHLQPS